MLGTRLSQLKLLKTSYLQRNGSVERREDLG